MEPADILRRSWLLYRGHWRRLLPIAALVYLPVGAVSALLTLAGWPGIAIANLLNLAAIFLVQGALVAAVERVDERGEEPVVAESLGRAGGRIVTLATAGLLAAAGIVAGLALLIVPGLVLLTWWLVLVPVIMLERERVTAAFTRSRALVIGHGWPVFGVALATTLILLAFGLVLAGILQPLSGAVSSLAQSAVGNTLAAPFAAVAWTLTYFRLRDIEAAERPEPA
ncbi:MAG: hypothetical protein AB7V42_01065 [Thermoleophilia bacterium]